jgi:hypothetical protein
MQEVRPPSNHGHGQKGQGSRGGPRQKTILGHEGNCSIVFPGYAAKLNTVSG